MTRKLVTILLTAALLVSPALTIRSDSSIKIDDKMLSEGKSDHRNPTVFGKHAAWYQQRINYWGYVVMLKNLDDGTLTCISNSETHLPIPNNSDATKVWLSDKYCWWHAFGLANFYDYRIFVYDIENKKAYEYGDSTAQLINPVVVKGHLFYLRKIDSPKSLELYAVKIGSGNTAKKIYTYDTETWGYSYQTGDIAGDQVVWTDKSDVWMYDINKSKVTQLTKTKETEYFPIIQNGVVYFNLLSYKNSQWTYTICAYNIKEEVSFKVNIREGSHWQRPSYNPTSNHFIFTQQYTEQGKTINALCLYDPKQDITKEVKRFSSMPIINSQCSSKDFLVWFDNSSGKNCLMLYNYKTNETFTANSTTIFEADKPIRIDGRNLIWMDSRNGRQDLYTGTAKFALKN